MSNSKKQLIIGIIMFIIGVTAVLAAIFFKKPENTSELISYKPDQEISSTKSGASENQTYTEEDILQYLERIQYLEKDNEELRAKLYVSEPQEESSVYDDIKKDLVLTFQLYCNMRCNGGYECKYKYLYHKELADERLTPEGINRFMPGKLYENLLSKTGEYAIDNCTQDTVYFIDRYIDCIDILVSDLDKDKMTATYCCIYRTFETKLVASQTDRTYWRIVYGRVVYNPEKNIWQADTIYERRDFNADPTNVEDLIKESDPWLKNSGFWEKYVEYGNGY